MKMYVCFIVVLVVLNFLGVLAEIPGEVSDSSCLYCLVLVANIQYEDIDKYAGIRYMCRTEPDQNGGHDANIYKLDGLSSDFLSRNENELSSGHAYMCIPGGQIDHEQARIIALDEGEIYFLDYARRKLAITGRRSLLAVHLTVNGQSPLVSASEFQAAIFGDANSGEVSMTQQYSACSFSGLTFYPATGPNIEDGVARLNTTIPNYKGIDITYAFNQVLSATEAQLGLLYRYDHVIFCIPFGGVVNEEGAWLGWAFLDFYLTFINSHACKWMTLLMHEVGHNLGMRHASEQRDQSGCDEYGDWTDIMGESWRRIDGPQYCFNGRHNAFLGWYAEKMLQVYGGWTGRLASFNDYPAADTSRNEYVLIEVNGIRLSLDGKRMDKFYLQFNVAEGINAGVYEYKNQITVTTGRDNDFTYLLGAVKEFESRVFAGITITVCGYVYGSPDYAVVSISRDNSADCSSEPIPFSTNRPSISPFFFVDSPVLSPLAIAEIPVQSAPPDATPFPSNPVPSDFPSVSPSALPTKRPSQSPSVSTIPSVQNSQLPSHLLFVSPSRRPSMSPTPSPSAALSMSPSDGPFAITTSSPSFATSAPEVTSLSPQLVTPSSSRAPSYLPSSPPSMSPSRDCRIVGLVCRFPEHCCSDRCEDNICQPDLPPSESLASYNSPAPSHHPSLLPSVSPSRDCRVVGLICRFPEHCCSGRCENNICQPPETRTKADYRLFAERGGVGSQADRDKLSMHSPST